MTSSIPLPMTSQPPKRSKAFICMSILISLYLNKFCKLNTVLTPRLQDLTDRDLAKHEREKTLNSLEAFIFETQVRTAKWAAIHRSKSGLQHKTTIHAVCLGQAVPGGLPAGGIRGRAGADLSQTEGGVWVDGRGRILCHHQGAQREAVGAQEPVQEHVL